MNAQKQFWNYWAWGNDDDFDYDLIEFFSASTISIALIWGMWKKIWNEKHICVKLFDRKWETN